MPTIDAFVTVRLQIIFFQQNYFDELGSSVCVRVRRVFMRAMKCLANPFFNQPLPLKRTISLMSPVEGDRKQGKHTMALEDTLEPSMINKESELKDVIGPLVTEMKMLRESMGNRIMKLEDAIATQRQEVTEEIHKLEETVTSHKDTVAEQLKGQVKENQ